MTVPDAALIPHEDIHYPPTLEAVPPAVAFFRLLDELHERGILLAYLERTETGAWFVALRRRNTLADTWAAGETAWEALRLAVEGMGK